MYTLIAHRATSIQKRLSRLPVWVTFVMLINSVMTICGTRENTPKKLRLVRTNSNTHAARQATTTQENQKQLEELLHHLERAHQLDMRTLPHDSKEIPTSVENAPIIVHKLTNNLLIIEDYEGVAKTDRTFMLEPHLLVPALSAPPTNYLSQALEDAALLKSNLNDLVDEFARLERLPRAARIIQKKLTRYNDGSNPDEYFENSPVGIIYHLLEANEQHKLSGQLAKTSNIDAAFAIIASELGTSRSQEIQHGLEALLSELSDEDSPRKAQTQDDNVQPAENLECSWVEVSKEDCSTNAQNNTSTSQDNSCIVS